MTMPPRRERQSEESICSEVRGDNAENIAGVFDAPFPIYSEAEGERYEDLLKKSIEVPTYFNFELLEQIGLKDKFVTLCRRGGWQYFVQQAWPVYRDLTLEFFTSLRYVIRRPQKLWFRLRGRVCYLDKTVLRHVCQFPENRFEDAHQGFSVPSYWKHLTDLDVYDPHVASNASIVQPELKLLHKFMCGCVFGKRQSTKCSTKELFLLWCMEHGHKPNMFTFVSRALIELVGRRGSNLGMGYLATAIAQFYSLDLTDLEALQYQYFDVPYLTRCEIIHGTTQQLRNPSTRSVMKRRLVAGESSSIGHRVVSSGTNVHGVDGDSDSEGQQPQPQHLLGHQHSQEQQSQANSATMHQLMLRNQHLMAQYHRRTQERFDGLAAQMHRMNQQLVNLNARVQDIDDELQYMDYKLRKAWEVQGLDVPSSSVSGGGNPEMGGSDAAASSSS